MTRKRDKLATWFGLPGRPPTRRRSKQHAHRKRLQAESGSQPVANDLEPRLEEESEQELEPYPEAKDDSTTKESEDEDKLSKSTWHRAWASLNSSDRQLIESVVQDFDASEDVFSDLERVALQRKQEVYDHHWSHNEQLAGKQAVRIRVVISKIITCLRRFKEVGDIAVSFDPTHAALPWAAFRFVLEALTVNDEQLELLFDGLERVSLFGLRVRCYENLYLRGSCGTGSEAVAQLEQALISLCRDMLSFMAMAIKILNKNAASRAIGALFDPSAVSDLLMSINFRATQADIEASNCERFLSLEDRKKLHNLVAEELVNIDARIEELWVRLQEEERSQLLQWLSPIHYASDHEFARSGRVFDTGSWLLGREAFKLWKESSVSQIFWLHGIPGAGKTKLSSKVIDDAESHLDKARNKETLIYFYCDRNRSDHRDPASVTRSLIRQLSADTNSIEGICKIVDEQWRLERRKGFPSTELAFETCKEFLPKLIAAYAKTVLVLDGLDECDKESRHELIRLLDSLVKDSSGVIKVFISSREDRDLFENYISRTHLRVQANDNADDIKAFVLAQLENTSNSWFREKLPPGLRASILQTFSEKSDGMFQWAVLQMKDLLQLKRASDVESYLGSLPKGLRKAYQKILSDIGNQAGSAGVIAARAFRWIMDSARPLSPNELVAAACQSCDGLVDFDPDVNIEFLLEACHNLVVVIGSTCRFSHLSVQEYLETNSWPNKPDDELLGAVCLHLLIASNDVFAMNSLNEYAALYWYQHVTHHESGASGTKSVAAPLFLKFLGHPTRSSKHYRKWADRLTAWKWEGPEGIDSSDLQPSRWSAFGTVALGLLDTVTRWIEDRDLDPQLHSSERCLLHLAVKSGNLAMCSRLIDSGADLNYSSPALGTPLLRAVLERHYSIIELLVKQPGIDIDKGRDRSGAPALCNAVVMKDARIVGLLLVAGGDPNLMEGDTNSQEAQYNGFTPALHVAVSGGAVDMIRLLLRYKANPNLVAGVYRTPLIRAVSAGHEAAARCLIENGADVNLHRPLYHSHSVGENINETIMVLVDNGALDFVLDLPLDERTDLDEQYSGLAGWLDERLAMSDVSRRRRRLIRMFDAGAFRTGKGRNFTRDDDEGSLYAGSL